MALMRLETVYLEVGDPEAVDACREFYTAHLGLHVTSDEPGESVWLDAEGIRLGFHIGSPSGNPAAINLSFEVRDVDEEARRLADAGLKIVQAPVEVPWGGRVMTLLDPAGHAVWLSEPPKQ